jgi:Fe-S-cluster formation regulator IscX/YfhJ
VARASQVTQAINYESIRQIASQLVDFIDLRGWLAALDDFRNWLIREAA